MTKVAMVVPSQNHPDLIVSGKRIDSLSSVSNLIPGDKSISHRAMLLAALSAGPTWIRGLNQGNAVEVLVPALRALGVRVERQGVATVIEPPTTGLQPPKERLDLGSSSTAARLLIGLLAGLGLPAEVDGDDSLRARPMEWVVQPLVQLGARIRYLNTVGRLPIAIERATIRQGTVSMTVGSAQASSAVMFASVASGVPLHIIMLARSRDHTERLLRALGTVIEDTPDGVWIQPRELNAIDEYVVPADPSSAVYPAAGHVFQGRGDVMRLPGVCVNPTRTGFFDLLRECGFGVHFENLHESWGEPIADIVLDGVRTTLRPFRIIERDRMHSLIDEVPLAMALGTFLEGTSEIGQAGELGFKETNRLLTTQQMLQSLGATVTIGADHIRIDGRQRLQAGTVDSFGDHRISMAAATLGCALNGQSRIIGGSCYDTSFPNFPAAMSALGFHVIEQVEDS
jgi:3-phosphoshikimate 1-carboxyvinyltransferase